MRRLTPENIHDKHQHPTARHSSGPNIYQRSLSPHSPLGHDEVAIHRRPEGDVDAAHRVDVAEDEQHGSGHGLQHLHDALEALAGHFAHVGVLLPAQDVGQAQLPHVDGPLQQHLAEQEVLFAWTEKSAKSTTFTAGNVQIVTFDAKRVGVLPHGGLVSQDYGPPQLTERHSVTARVQWKLEPPADVLHGRL